MLFLLNINFYYFYAVALLTEEIIDSIMSEDKPNQIPKIKFNENRIRSVLPKNIEDKKIEDYVVNAIEFYNKHLQRQKSMDAR